MSTGLYMETITTEMVFRTLLDKIHWTGAMSFVQVCIIKTHIINGDIEYAEKMLRDFDKRPTRPISKWMPGAHYYALDQKFNTQEQAERHLGEHGYKSSGVEITKVRDQIG